MGDLRKLSREETVYRVYLDPDRHPGLTAEKLRRMFAPKGREAIFHLWDFGVGDRLRLPATVVATFSKKGHEVKADVPVKVR